MYATPDATRNFARLQDEGSGEWHTRAGTHVAAGHGRLPTHAQIAKSAFELWRNQGDPDPMHQWLEAEGGLCDGDASRQTRAPYVMEAKMNPHTIDSTIDDLVDEYPSLASMLQELGISPCHCRDKSLRDVCDAEGIDAVAVIDVVSADDTAITWAEIERGTDWQAVPLEEMLDHVVATQHGYLRRQTRRLRLLLDKVRHDAAATGVEEPGSVVGVDSLIRLLGRYMQEEERFILPLFRTMCDSRGHSGQPISEIAVAVAGTEVVKAKITIGIETLRHATGRFRSSFGDFTAYQSLMQELGELERKLEEHFYFEDEVLIPKALSFQRQSAS